MARVEEMYRRSTDLREHLANRDRMIGLIALLAYGDTWTWTAIDADTKLIDFVAGRRP